MKFVSETYHKARLAGAKPIILAIVSSNKATRCFGKQTPDIADEFGQSPVFIGDDAVYIGDSQVFVLDGSADVLEWKASVLTFGDWRQSLTQEDGALLASLNEQEMSTYTLTCDNADGYFTGLCGKEEFLGGKLQLFQGFEYPGFLFADYIQLFNGIITDVTLTKLQCVFVADLAVAISGEQDQEINSTATYVLYNPGTGFVAAQETFSYSELEDIFYTETEWLIRIEFVLEQTDTEQHLFEIINASSGNTRLEIGLNSNNQPYIKMNVATPAAAPDYHEYTFDELDFVEGENNILIVSIPPDTADIKAANQNGSQTLSADYTLTFVEKFGSSGIGNGELYFPVALACDAFGSVFVGDRGTGLTAFPPYQYVRLQKFDAGGDFIYSVDFGDMYLFGIAYDTYSDIVYVYLTNYFSPPPAPALPDYFIKAYRGMTGEYLFEFTTPVTGLFSDSGIAVSVDGYVYISTYDPLTNIKVFDWQGQYINGFGILGSGDGEFGQISGIAVSPISGDLFIADYGNKRIQKITPAGTYLAKTSGTLTDPIEIACHDRYVVVTVSGTRRVFIYDDNLNLIDYIGSLGSGDGQFQNITGVAFRGDNQIVVTDYTRDDVQVFQKTPILFNQDDGGNDIVFIGQDFGGNILPISWGRSSGEGSGGSGSARLAEYANTQNDGALLAVPENIASLVSGNDMSVALVDGTWVEYGTIDVLVTELAEESELSIFEEMIPPTAGEYSDPGENQSNVILPLPYGNLIENSDGGVWACPCIDSANFVYCVAGWPVQPIASGNVVSVYVSGELVPSGYTFYDSNSYESLRDIAMLQFSADPGGDVSVRCNGKWVDGALLTNPVDIISDLLEYAASLSGNVGWAKDDSTFASGKAFCAANQYTCAGVILQNQSIAYWLKNILNSFAGTFSFTSDGTIKLSFLKLEDSAETFETVQEYEAITLAAKKNMQGICRRVLANYALSLVTIDRRFKKGGESSYFRTSDISDELVSIKSYRGDIWTLNFDWTRNTETVEKIANRLLELYSDPQWIIAYSGQDIKFLPVDLLDQVEMTCSLIVDSNGTPIENKVFQLRAKTINLDDFTTQLTLQSVGDVTLDLPVYIGTEPVYIGLSRVYISSL